MLFVIASTLLIYSHTAFAAIEPNYYIKKPDQVPFFKSTKSLFPSGSTNLEKLKKNLIKTESTTGRFYEWNKVFFSEEEIMPLFATHLSQYVIENGTTDRYKVIDASTKTLVLLNERSGATIKMPIQNFHADAYDLGLSMILKDAYLKTSSSEKAQILTTIPQGTRVKVEKFAGAYAKVVYQNYHGYVQIAELVTKFDLATFVCVGNEWHQVDKRELDVVVTKKKQRIPLNKIRGMITPDHIGLIASSSQKIPLGSKVIRSKATQVTTWQQSRLKDHGLVWWQPNKSFEQVYYSIDEILKMKIASVSFHPNDAMKGIVSANGGVYITQNGNQWRKLSQFDNYTGPVYYLNNQLLFVGNFRSLDGGRTFENYIQIDKLASAIEYQYGFVPKQLQVRKIESPTPMRILIEIDTGGRKLKMESPLFSQNWQPARI